MVYSCTACHIHTSNRADYKKHIRTKKHLKNIANIGGTPGNESDNHSSDIESAYENEVCLNITDISDNSKHEYTGFSIPNKTKPTVKKVNNCKFCGIGYSYSSGLYRHMKICTGRTNETQSNTTNMNTIITTLLHENKQFKQIIMDVLKTNNEITKNTHELIKQNQDTTNKVLDICKNNQSSVTNNIYNHKGDNNTFNLTVFLNEKCKDAMNMTDFVNTIEVTMNDMENVGRRGYVEGISSIFIDNLKNTDVHKRPIHCSDRKREVLYVKHTDRWERDSVDSQKLKHAVLVVEQKHMGLVNKWADEHPGCEKSDNHANNMYMNICRNVSDGNDDKILKVVKNIAKESVIEKEALIV